MRTRGGHAAGAGAARRPRHGTLRTARSDLRVAACELFLHESVSGVQVSDNYGVLADFEPPEREPEDWPIKAV